MTEEEIEKLEERVEKLEDDVSTLSEKLKAILTGFQDISVDAGRIGQGTNIFNGGESDE